MQDDKRGPVAGPKQQPGQEKKAGERQTPQPEPVFERSGGFGVEREVGAERGVEQERAPEKEIEQVREQLRPGQVPASDDEEEEKLKVLKEADKLRDMKYEGRKIEHLMQLVEAKGVEFAVEVVKKTNDACLLDLFHDKIIEKGLHQELD